MKSALLTSLVVATAHSATATSTATQPSQPAKPNIIFLLVDDMGYMDIGANNPNTFYETPNIDRLAAQGMRFTDGYAACPVCSPTRASIMTGKYPPRVGITNYLPWTGKGGGHLALEEITIAEAMRDAGYTTFFSGKWHLGDGKYSPNAQGFGPGLLGSYYEYLPHNTDPRFPDPINPIKPFDKDDPKRTDRIASDFAQFMETCGDKPFFAYLSFQAVHCAIGARADLIAKYKSKPTPPPVKLGAEELRKRGRQKLNQDNPTYAAMIEQLDHAVGQIMATVQAKGVAGRTIVIFMSDNGAMSTGKIANTSNLPLRGGKTWLYEGGIREPWIIHAPGVTRPGSKCATPVISNDFYPTILELAGVAPMPKQHCDGMSLVPLLKGGQMKRGPLYWHYPHIGGGLGGRPAGAVRDGNWKLIEWYETGKVELFNLKDDIGEKDNLAVQNPAKVKELETKLSTWRQDVNAVMPSHCKTTPTHESHDEHPAIPACETEEES